MNPIIQPGAATPVLDLISVKAHCRVYPADASAHPDDALLQRLISAATRWAEGYTRLAIAQRPATVFFPAGNGVYRLPLHPVRSITGGEYQDSAGNWQPLTYTASLIEEPAVIELDDYPADLADVRYPIRFILDVGFETVPADVEAAMLTLIGHWYANREAAADTNFTSVPLTANDLLYPYRRLST